MIFASDLDRTLIYSEKFLKEFSEEAVAVEYGKYNSYMTKHATELLKVINRKTIFVPCTTRTIEQYQRIQFFQEEVRPKYAVVSNGANLLFDGIIDIEYQKGMARTLVNECLASEEIRKEYGKLDSVNWSQPLRQADGVFYYCIIDREKAPLLDLASFSEWVSKQNWEMSIQGRKLYLVPRVINKWSAIQRIVEITGDEQVFGAGDSLLDIPLVKGAQRGISPAHGELFEQFASDGDWNFTAASGMLAGEEILQLVSELVQLKWKCQ